MKTTKIIFFVLLIAAAAGILFLIRLPSSYLERAIESEFSADFSFAERQESLRGIHFSKVVLKDSSTGLPMLEADAVWVRAGLFSRFNLWNLRREIHFDNPILYFRKQSAGSWNWLSAKINPKNPIPAAPSDRSYSFRFGQGKLNYYDESARPPVHWKADFSSAEFTYQPGLHVNGALRFTGAQKLPGTFLFGFTYNSTEDELTFQLSSNDRKVEASGTVREFSSDFYSQFFIKLNTKQMMLVSPKGVGFAGLATAQFEGVSQGSHPKVFNKYLGLKGAFDIRHGTLLRTNLLSQILKSLSPVASLQLQTLPGKSAPDYKGIIRAADTSFDILQAGVQVEQGLIYLDDLRIQHNDYYVEGEGSYDLPNGRVDFRARYVALEELSAWFLRENSAYKAFEHEASGRLLLPFLYRGLAPDVDLEMNWDSISASVQNTQIREAAASHAKK